MRPQIIVKGDPVSQYPTGMLDRFKAVTMDALLFDGADQSFDHAVLLCVMTHLKAAQFIILKGR